MNTAQKLLKFLGVEAVEYFHHSRNKSNTKKGPGRVHLYGKVEQPEEADKEEVGE